MTVANKNLGSPLARATRPTPTSLIRHAFNPLQCLVDIHKVMLALDIFVPGFTYEHIENFMKERVARQSLGNRARSPVSDRAHMKKPSVYTQFHPLVTD